MFKNDLIKLLQRSGLPIIVPDEAQIIISEYDCDVEDLYDNFCMLQDDKGSVHLIVDLDSNYIIKRQDNEHEIEY